MRVSLGATPSIRRRATPTLPRPLRPLEELNRVFPNCTMSGSSGKAVRYLQPSVQLLGGGYMSGSPERHRSVKPHGAWPGPLTRAFRCWYLRASLVTLACAGLLAGTPSVLHAQPAGGAGSALAVLEQRSGAPLSRDLPSTCPSASAASFGHPIAVAVSPSTRPRSAAAAPMRSRRAREREGRRADGDRRATRRHGSRPLPAAPRRHPGCNWRADGASGASWRDRLRILLPGIAIDTTLTVVSTGARGRAGLVGPARQRRGPSAASPSVPARRSSIRDSSSAPTENRLVWFIEARRCPRELIWVDARDGHVLLHFSQLTDARTGSPGPAGND